MQARLINLPCHSPAMQMQMSQCTQQQEPLYRDKPPEPSGMLSWFQEPIQTTRKGQKLDLWYFPVLYRLTWLIVYLPPIVIFYGGSPAGKLALRYVQIRTHTYIWDHIHNTCQPRSRSTLTLGTRIKVPLGSSPFRPERK